MSIMAESGYAENEVYSARPPATRDWLHHANQSLSRLKDVKRTSYWLGGGPRERQVNCQCNYRSKSKNSFISLEAEPPQLPLDSQETASMPDLSIPEIVKQFNERQSQKSKQKKRPHSSAIYSTRNAAGKQDREKPSDYSYNAFITVTGQTVTPQVRPPHGPQPTTEQVKKDESAYKGLVYLDPQQVEQNRTSKLEGLGRYSAAFCDNENAASTIPPPPRTSPEPTSPRTNSPELIESAEEYLSEDDDDIISKPLETRSVSSAQSRSLVFAIPTAVNEGSEDEDSHSDVKAGRLSADYVAESEVLLGELSEKNQTEAAEISGMLLDMENAKEKVSQLRISPRDLELECVSRRPGQHSSGASSPSVHLDGMAMDCPPADETRQEDGFYETFWVEEPADSYISSALPFRSSRVCSARYMSQHITDSGRVRKHQSESSLVLKGKTVEFFNSEDLAAKNRMRDTRRTLKPDDQFSNEEHSMLEEKVNITSANKAATKPPLPKWNTTKSNKKHTSRQKHRSVNKTSDSVRNQLSKSNSEGNIHLSADRNLSKKSVTFSQDVFYRDANSDASCEISTRYNNEDEKTSGVVIQNGLEMKETDLEIQEKPETATTKVGHTHKTNQSTRAKLLAKMKEIPRDEDPCPCRTVTRPTAALLTESRSGKTGTKEISSRKEKLLKNRSTRPSSAPIKRLPGFCGELTTERPKTPVKRKPRAMSATVQRKRTGSEGGQSRPRPSSAHVGKSSSKDARRSRAAAKVLKEGYLFKERHPPQLPPGSRERQQKREEKSKSQEDNNNSLTLTRSKDEDEVVASEECQEVFARLQEKGIAVSMDTIKRGLMAPARRASDYQVAAMGTSSGLLSRPENWLTEEHARVQIWENALKQSK